MLLLRSSQRPVADHRDAERQQSASFRTVYSIEEARNRESDSILSVDYIEHAESANVKLYIMIW